jgi:BirA family transcriptional regulator, biotin operon repressor / biotin---[acetyl-CoA-carboxylase] ligase
LELLDKNIITQHVNHEWHHYLNNMVIFDELPSTNTYLSEQAKTNNNTFSICFAEHQTAGKGRLGRRWISPFAENIYLSLLWPFNFNKESHELSGLSLAIAVAITEALNRYGIKNNIALKWPNDVLWKNRKIAGILIELTKKPYNIYNAVIGVGLNVNMRQLAAEQIEQPWCSVAQITDAVPEKNKLAGLLLNELLKAIFEYKQHGLKSFIKKWQQLDITCGKKVIITTQQTEITGTSLGINEQGHFLLNTTIGNRIMSFIAGEISLTLIKV